MMRMAFFLVDPKEAKNVVKMYECAETPETLFLSRGGALIHRRAGIPTAKKTGDYFIGIHGNHKILNGVNYTLTVETTEAAE